jgi:hypothetical protein
MVTYVTFFMYVILEIYSYLFHFKSPGALPVAIKEHCLGMMAMRNFQSRSRYQLDMRM